MIQKGDTVYLAAYEREAIVAQVLSFQFSVKVNKNMLFFFLEDIGETWRLPKQKKDV
jgi:hypothetical protein